MTSSPSYTPAPASDFVLPFSFDNVGLRGRLVRLDSTSSRALSAHRLPEPAQRTLAEALALSAILGSALKLEGRLSVQLKGDGPLDLLVTDYFAGGEPSKRHGGLRGYARLDEKALAELGGTTDFAALTGKGALAITIEPKLGAQAYQGLVSLSPEGLAASAQVYFSQSEQLPTKLRLAAAPIYQAGVGHGWRAGGLMVQALPGKAPGEVEASDDWRRVGLFLDSLEDIELLDSEISAESVLWRLFHEDEVRVHRIETLGFECSCRPDRIRAVLNAYPAEDLKDLPDPDGVIRTRCEFCGTIYEFPLATLGA
jgi:molecular chaperone Hsp33